MWSLDERGINKLEQAYAADSIKQRQLYLEDPAAADRRRVNKVLGYVRDFSGKLTEGQVKRITEITLAVHMPHQDWVTDRELRKRDLVELLRAKKSRLGIEAALRDWWLRFAARILHAFPDKILAGLGHSAARLPG